MKGFPGCVVLLFSGILFSSFMSDFPDDDVLSTRLERLADDDEAAAAYLSADHLSDLENLQAHPPAFAFATRADFEPLYFLSDVQVNALLRYRTRFGTPLFSDAFALTGRFSPTEIARIRPFVRLDDAPSRFRLSEAFRRGDHSFHLLSSYRPRPAYPAHLGMPWGATLRYAYRSADGHLTLSFTADHDRGEPFFRKNYHGFDALAPALEIRDWGPVHILALGAFRATWGCGLVLNTRPSFGISDPNLLLPRERPVSASMSSDMYHNLMGLSATLRLGSRVLLSPLFSSRRLDGTLAPDGSITSVKTDGLHRTLSEIGRYHTFREWLYGLRATAHFTLAEFGVSVLSTHYDHPVSPRLTAWTRHAFRGSDATLLSADYTLGMGHFSFRGEHALDLRSHAVASIGALFFSPVPAWRFTALYRIYPTRYHAPRALSFSRWSGVRGERGVCLAAEGELPRHIRLTLSYDLARSPMPRAYTYGTSAARRTRAEVSYSPAVSHTLTLRMRYRSLSASDSVSSAVSSCRLAYRYAPRSGVVRLRALSEVQTAASRWAYALLCAARVRVVSGLHAEVEVAYFDAPTYDLRFSLYETPLRYAPSLVSLYGRGFRTMSLVSYTPRRMFTLALRVGLTFPSSHYATTSAPVREVALSVSHTLSSRPREKSVPLHP